MLKREAIIEKLIADGYNEELVNKLPKVFLEDFFDREQEKISDTLDSFIDLTQRGVITPDDNHNVRFGTIIKMEEYDFDSKSKNGLYYNFKSHINEEFNHIIKRRPLKDILLSGGAMQYEPELEGVSYDPVSFKKEVVGSPLDYKDLYDVRTYDGRGFYIKANDLVGLLKRKGLTQEDISLAFGVYDKDLGTGFYINHDAIMQIGNIVERKQRIN